MFKPAILGVLAFAALFSLSTASAQAPAVVFDVTGQKPVSALTPLGPGVYMVTGGGGNSVVRVGADGVIVVDTKDSAQNFDALMALIRTVSDQPVKYVFNTHAHNDHTTNNERFEAAGAVVIAHENLPALLAPMRDGRRPAPPTRTYKKRIDVAVSGAKATGYNFGPAHTGGDTIVFFPDVKVVALGDELIFDMVINPDFANGGSIKGWLHSLDETLKLDFQTAVPGHGPEPVTYTDVKAFRDKLAAFLARAKAAIKAGATKDQLMERIKVEELGLRVNPAHWTPGPRLDGLWREAGGKS